MKKRTVTLLEKSRKQVSKVWGKFNEKKQAIENRKLSRWVKNKKIEELRNKTYGNISKIYENYQNVKYVIEEKESLPFARLVRFKNLTNKSEKVYKVKDESKATDIVGKIFSKDSKAMVLVVYKCLNDEGVTCYVSRSLTYMAYKQIIERGESVESNLQEKAESSKSDVIMEFVQLYIKVYANVKRSKKSKKG